MSGFEMNFYSVSKDFHRFSTDDFALLQIGIGNFNTSSLAKFLGLRFLDGSFQSAGRALHPDISEFFTNEVGVELANKLVGKDSVDKMEILAFDEEDKVYQLKSGFGQIVQLNPNKYDPADFTQPANDLTSFLNNWNKIQVGAESNAKVINGHKAVVHRIQSSLSGCILYDVDLNILGTSRKSQMRLYFLNTKDNESSKTISFNGSPFISALPQDATGLIHSRSNTDAAPPGVFSPPSKPNGGPEDMVGAQMRLAYDPATKTWESGTQQVLARLVDDIDAVNITELSGEEMLSISSSQTYGVPPEDNPWMGKFKAGRAIPLSTEDGNPNLYGPNFKGGCENTSNSVVIMAVNRSAKSFKSGRLVVLSFINGEWIIVGGEGEEKSGSGIRFKNFEYSQYLIPAKYYFSVPNSSARILPESLIQKYRYEFYLVDKGIKYFNDTPLSDVLIRLNILASQIPLVEDPIQYIIDNFQVSNQIINQARAFIEVAPPDNRIFPKSLFSNVEDFKLMGNFTPEQEFPVPKNLQTRIKNVLALDMPSIFDNNDELRPGRWEAPLFWGALFPDGYRSGMTKKFIADPKYKLNSAEIYSKDPNLSELSIKASMCLPYFKDLDDLYRYYKVKFGVGDMLENLPSRMRKTGVIVNINDIVRLKNRDDHIEGLEPLRPNKIQFTPMSIDLMYSSASILNTDSYNGTDFSYLQYSYALMESEKMNLGGKTFSYLDYAKFLFSEFESFIIEDNYYPGNVYGSRGGTSPFSHLSSFGGDSGPTILRHAPPIATPNRNNVWPVFPKTGQTSRSPSMAVTTIKSTIVTSANGLRFVTNQRFGYKQRSTITPAQGPQVTFIPLGVGGISWNTPNSPVSVRQNPQWGNTTDRIDAFGSTALFVKVFEHWPEKDTDYNGGLFLPLHYNDRVSPSSLFKKKYDPEKDTWSDVLNNDGDPIPYISPLDFREPTEKSNTTMNLGATVTVDNLANFSNWKYNKIRRNKLLSAGGFVYLRRAIFVANANLDPAGLGAAGGSGYKVGEKFVYPDGFTLEIGNVKDVTLTDGTVLKDSIDSFIPTSNLDDNLLIKRNDLYRGNITSVSNVAAAYDGESGRGAILKANFVIGQLVGYDPAPKEVIPQTRITKPSLRGVDLVDGVLSTTLEFDETDKREFDIFYYFQNDPFVYALNSLLHDDYDAHYVFCEVNPL